MLSSIFDNDSLGDIPEALQQCERTKGLDVCLELELRGSLDAAKVKRLQEDIQQNPQITTVKLHLHGEWEEVSAANRATVAHLVDTAGHLPNLKEIVIVGDFVPIPAVSRLLNHASKLETMKLEQFRNLKSCDTSILVAFSNAIRRHKVLKAFTFAPCIDGPEPQEEVLLNLLLESLSKLSTLKQVELATNNHSLTGPLFVNFCNSSSILKSELNPRGGVAVDGLEALSGNTTIQELIISCVYSEQTSAALTQLIQTNTTLRKLSVVFHETWKEDDSHDRFVVTLAKALKTNVSLSDLRLSMGNPYPSIGVLKAFVDIFSTNYTIQDLELFEDASRVQRTSYDEIDGIKDETAKGALLLGKKIQYYTILNRSGRGELLGNQQAESPPGKIQWVEKLVEFSYSLDRIFFFLRANPTLCSSCDGDGGGGPDRRGFVEPTGASDLSPKSARKRGRQNGHNAATETGF